MFQIVEFFADRRPNNGHFFLLAIDGRGASGKSVLSDLLQQRLPDWAFLGGDDYFEPTPGELAWGGFNDDRFGSDVIEPLKRGSDHFTYRPYDWHREPHVSTEAITVGPGLGLERCFSFAFDLPWDLRIWVETPREICLERGVAKDEGAYPPERVRAVWEEWAVREDEYISRLKPQHSAEVVVDGTQPFESQIV